MVKYIGYARVSTPQQGDYGLSLSEQVARVNAMFAKLPNVNNATIIRDVCSGHKLKNSLDKLISTTSDRAIIVISDVSRFCRNVAMGIDKLNNMVAKGHKIYFIRENILIDSNGTVGLARAHLEQAQLESERISERIKRIKQFKLQNGEYLGGGVPYGLEIYINRDGVKKYKFNDNEMNIIKFIQMARNPPYTSFNLNGALNDILGYVSPDPIILLNPDGVTPRDVNTDALTPSEIVALLNDYGVRYRGSAFTAAMVRNIRPIAELERYVHMRSLDEHVVDELCGIIDRMDVGIDDDEVVDEVDGDDDDDEVDDDEVDDDDDDDEVDDDEVDELLSHIDIARIPEMVRQFMAFQKWYHQQ